MAVSTAANIRTKNKIPIIIAIVFIVLRFSVTIKVLKPSDLENLFAYFWMQEY